MVTEEFIKRGYKKGYDENGKLLYKIRADETSPLEMAEEATEEEMPPLNLV